MHHVLVKNNKVVHVWHGPIPPGIDNTFAVAPDSAHVGDDWDGQRAVPQAPAIIPDEVNRECERRILELFPITRQLNIIDEGTPAEVDEMKQKRNALRACARALCSMQPIPQNFRDDRFWVGSSFNGGNGSPQTTLNYQQSQSGYPQLGYAPGTNQPIIMMQAPAQPAPIIINGAAPGTTVIQGPASVQHPVAPAINVVQPSTAPALPQAGYSTSAPAGLPAPHRAGHVIDEDEIVYETAARALAGSDAAIAYMTAIAAKNGSEWKPYCEALMKDRFERFDKVLKAKAAL